MLLDAIVTLLLHSFLFFTFTFSEEQDLCSRFQWGAYCTPDLSGYRECTGWNWIRTNQFQKDREVKCPDGTRCSCFQGNDCFGFLQLAEKDICKPYVEAYPLEKVLFLKYSTHGWRQLDTLNAENEEFSKEGEIKQDISKKSKLHAWIEFDRKYFELVIPDESNSYSQYAGTYPDTCTRTSIPSFIPFGNDIQHYTQGNTKKTYKNNEIQTWYTNVYHQEGLGLVKNWTVVANTGRKRMVPIFFESSYTASQENQCCDHFERTKYRQVEDTDSTNWFQVPDFCT